jgi:hypothetical protein
MYIMEGYMIRIVVLFTCLGLPSFVAAFAFTNEPDGFRNIKWETDISMNKAEMTELERSKDYVYYLRNGEKPLIGGAILDRITYAYWKNKFMSVLIQTSGIENKSALISAFHEQFGKPEKPNRFLDDYWWKGGYTTIRVKCEPIGTKCDAFIFSTQLMIQQREDEKKAAAGAGKDF